MPSVEYIEHRKAHVFECMAQSCHGRTRFVQWFLDKGDAKSTSNLHCHAKLCWGEETVSAADDTRDANTTHEALQHNKKLDGSITSVFQCTGKGQVTYSHHQHTKLEAQYVFSSNSENSHLIKFAASSLYVGSQRVNGLLRLWMTVGSSHWWRQGDWNIIFHLNRPCRVMSEMPLCRFVDRLRSYCK